MATVIWILLAQGCMGAFDTVYYHELRARLPGRPEARPELLLHAARDFVYAVIFATLPNLVFHGAWALVLAAMLLAEIGITLADFVVEDTVRRPQGGVFPGERVMHALMAIVYGAMLANLVPILWAWWALPTALESVPAGVPEAVRLVMGGMAIGVGASGVRDLLAALGVAAARWPYAAGGR
jgi:hypothetical protein